LIKLTQNSKRLKYCFKFKSNKTILDVITLCNKKGFIGFYIYLENEPVINLINSQLKYFNFPIIKKIITKDKIYYFIGSGKSECISLIYLDVLDIIEQN
jgi:ribosomal protein S8